MWKWSNFLHANSPSGRKIVRVNLDETAIRLDQREKNGHLTYAARVAKRSARSLTSSATTTQTRGMITLVAFICDNDEIQQVLPQVLIANEAHLTKAEPAAALRMHLGANTILWTGAKAWVTGALMCKIVNLLSQVLTPYKNRYHFIVSSDGYRAHMTKPVWRAFARAGFMYFLIPAKLTWALQPCDTHLFAALKRTLRFECQVLVLTTTDGRLTMTLLVRALARCISQVLRNTSWRTAFWDVGLTGVQACLSDRVLDKITLKYRPRISSSLPTLEELQAVFPARIVLPIDDIFRWFTQPAQRVAPVHVAVLAQNVVPAAHDPHRPWAGRLRSSSSLALPDGEALPSPPCPAPMMPPPEESPAPAPPPRVLPRGRRLLPWRARPARLPLPPPP